mmetsp:Transcript_17109/g.37809  ORF Transcript_17109/g.37809 Transcript_17109/m.37809 type:complete len:324 (-) Transcript_17109:787-1758(-)
MPRGARPPAGRVRGPAFDTVAGHQVLGAPGRPADTVRQPPEQRALRVPGHREHTLRLVHAGVRAEGPPGVRPAESPDGLQRDTVRAALSHEVEPPLHPRPPPEPESHARRSHALPLRDKPRQLPLRRRGHIRRDGRGRPRPERHNARPRHARPAPAAAQPPEEARGGPQGERRRRLLGGEEPDEGGRAQGPGVGGRVGAGGHARQGRVGLGGEDQHEGRRVQPRARAGLGQHGVQRGRKRRPRRRRTSQAEPMGRRPGGVPPLLRQPASGLPQVPPGRVPPVPVHLAGQGGHVRPPLQEGRVRGGRAVGVPAVPRGAGPDAAV